jgi:hypothetical protein
MICYGQVVNEQTTNLSHCPTIVALLITQFKANVPITELRKIVDVSDVFLSSLFSRANVIQYGAGDLRAGRRAGVNRSGWYPR